MAIKKNAMEDLLGTLAGPVEAAPAKENKVSEQKPDAARPKERICTTVYTDQMDKVRALAAQTGLPLTDIISFGLQLAIDRYEQQHGAIKTKRAQKKDLKDVFG